MRYVTIEDTVWPADLDGVEWVSWEPQPTEWDPDLEESGWTLWANHGTPDVKRLAWQPYADPSGRANFELVAAMRNALPVLLDIAEAAQRLEKAQERRSSRLARPGERWEATEDVGKAKEDLRAALSRLDRLTKEPEG